MDFEQNISGHSVAHLFFVVVDNKTAHRGSMN